MDPTLANLLREAQVPHFDMRVAAALAIFLGAGYMAGPHDAQQRVESAALERWLDEAAKYYRVYARDDRYLVEIGAGKMGTTSKGRSGIILAYARSSAPRGPPPRDFGPAAFAGCWSCNA